MLFRMSLSLLPLAVAIAVGCGGCATGEDSTPSGEAPFDSPTAIFAAFVESAKESNWHTAAELLTPESQAKMAGSLVGGARFLTSENPREQKELEELLARHGLDLDADSNASQSATYEEVMIELFKPVEDLPALIGELATWMEKNGVNESHGGLAEMQELREVSIEGDTAKAIAQTDRGPLPIEFRKVNAAWRMHLPDDEVDIADIAAADDPDIEVDQAIQIDAQTTVTGRMTMIVDGEAKSFDLNHAVAYRFEYQLAGPPTRVSTWVLLTPVPINVEDVQAQLEKNRDDLMEARPLFPDGPYLMFEIDPAGELIQVSGYADDVDSTSVGRGIAVKGIEQDLNIDGGRARGTVRLDEGKDDVLSFDVEIDVAHYAR